MGPTTEQKLPGKGARHDVSRAVILLSRSSGSHCRSRQVHSRPVHLKGRVGAVTHEGTEALSICPFPGMVLGVGLCPPLAQNPVLSGQTWRFTRLSCRHWDPGGRWILPASRQARATLGPLPLTLVCLPSGKSCPCSQDAQGSQAGLAALWQGPPLSRERWEEFFLPIEAV